MKPAKLVNLAPAVSTEVSRWCFDHWNLPLKEELHVPVFHVVALWLRLTGNNNRPLVLVDGRKLRSETEIVAYFDERVAQEKQLLPEETASRWFDEEVTYYRQEFRRKGVVKYMYFNLLQDRKLVMRSFTTGTPYLERLLARLLFGLVKRGLFAGLKLSAKGAAEGLHHIRAGFDRTEATLSDGRPYLAGERFTFLDIAFAATAAPALLLEGYRGNLPALEEVPADLQAVVRELRNRPAGKFAQSIYSKHRSPADPKPA